MKPLNQTERNKAFYRFLFFFLVTIGLIVAVVFFSIEVPFREGDKIRKEMLALQNERAVNDSFSVTMKEAIAEMDKFDPAKEPLSATKRRVEIRIDKMNQLLKSIPNGENSIYALMVRNIQDLNETKAQLTALKAQ
jgi:hypothetical protein